ncbi:MULTISPECIES: RagB/SusD family nutrient uptake outer membrane protein [Niastella]|uniref:RagB/SusD family nutrient uptake outer membrane protein n=1 Tax=Niastella soli TaxID=2821487 RepID=A0ABS3Z4T2_9BACT|nr:RagB/SusD family nutrient uptake outer membrane protein [Niastella soli]MBO9205156.1 RagB/SusD family nutrient uptake outer membrane protein [Niastella soli]
MPLFRLFNKWFVLIVLVTAPTLIAGCNKLLDAGSPSNKVVTPQVYANDSMAQAALIGIYYKMMETFGPFNGYMSRYPGLSSDDLNRTSVLLEDTPFLSNSLPSDNSTTLYIWTNFYLYVYQCNDLILGLTDNHAVTPALRDQLTGEAYFLRAFTYFYLVNLYGDVPLVLTTDYTKNYNRPRSEVRDVYDQMIADLNKAQDLLTNTYASTPDFPSARVRVNRLAVKALQARIHLYREEWEDAINASTEVIQSGIYQLETDLQQTFRYNSREAILQFMPVTPGYNTAEGGYFVPVVPTGRPAFVLSDSLLKYIEVGDLRQAWIRTVTVSTKLYRSPYKYKQNTATTPREEYNMVLRLAEQYCIRAEARARLDQLPEAVNDLNTIRKRAGLQNLTTISTQTQVLAAVEQERRMEFFAEWGHRWFDLKRWPARASDGKKRIDEVMSALRPATWKSTAALWPIPNDERIRNRALTQNPGYE